MKKAAGSTSGGLAGLKIDWKLKPCEPRLRKYARGATV
jgi:hypothetical protein